MVQRHQTLVAARLGGMIGSLLSVFSLYHSTVGAKGGDMVSVFQTVYSQCILILVSLGYYGLCKLCALALFPRDRRTPAKSLVHHPNTCSRREFVMSSAVGGSPQESSQSSLAEVRLTIRNVWVLVYGLGFVFFITGYCFLGLQPVCLTFIGLAIGVLSVDELLCPRRELPHWYTTTRFLTLLCTLLSLVLVSAPILDSVVASYITTLDIYSIVFGIIFPFCSQFILIIIRDSRRYTLGTVIEVCEFGFPFTAFLGVFHLCVAYGERYQADSDAFNRYSQATALSSGNISSAVSTTSTSYTDFRYWYHFNNTMVDTFIETDGAFLTFYALAPLGMIPAVVCYMSCALDGCAIDPLLSLTFVLCMEHFMVTHSPTGTPLAIAATVFCSVGLLTRIFCEYKPPLLGNELLYSMQGESSQLPHHVVWSRPGPTMRDCEAETEELAGDFPDSGNNMGKLRT